MMNDKLRKAIRIAEDNDWTVSTEEETKESVTFDFGKYSPADQDFSFSVQADDYELESLIDNIDKYYRNFDPSEEASYWMDSSGHGINGAPYDMKDLYEDMEACKEMIWELRELIS